MLLMCRIDLSKKGPEAFVSSKELVEKRGFQMLLAGNISLCLSSKDSLVQDLRHQLLCQWAERFHNCPSSQHGHAACDRPFRSTCPKRSRSLRLSLAMTKHSLNRSLRKRKHSSTFLLQDGRKFDFLTI